MATSVMPKASAERRHAKSRPADGTAVTLCVSVVMRPALCHGEPIQPTFGLRTVVSQSIPLTVSYGPPASCP